MEFPLTSQDKLVDKEHISERNLLLTETYVTDENAFLQDEGLISHIINMLLTLFVRSVQ